jgi:cell division protein FtsQ
MAGLLLSPLALAGAAFGVAHSPLFDIDEVRISGTTSIARETVLEAAGLAERRFLVDISTSKTAERLEQLSWVEQATVTKDWPGALEISILERTPVAATPIEGGVALFDATGRILGAALEPPPGVLEVRFPGGVGATGSFLDKAGRGAVEIAAAMPEELIGRVAAVQTTAAGEAEVLIRPSLVVRMGPPSDVAAKVVALRTMVEKADLRNVRLIDVRVPSAPVLTRG